MGLSRLLILSSLRTRPLRTVLSAFGILLGVAGLLAIQIINQAAFTSLSALFEGTVGKTDLIITPTNTSGEFLSDRVLKKVKESPEIELAAPTLQIRTSLALKVPQENTPLNILGLESGDFSLYGIDPRVDPSVREYELTQGTFLSADSEDLEIVLVQNFAEENELEVNDSVQLLAADGLQEFNIVGLIAKQGAGQNNNGAFGVISLENARELFNRNGEIDQIDILLEPEYRSASQIQSVKAALQARLGEENYVAIPAAQGERVNQMLSGFSIGLNFMAGMALFVGGYLIYNAFSMTILEQIRQFGILRTLGLTRQQIALQVLFDAALLGIGSSITGVVIGIVIAYGAARLLSYILELESIPIQVDQLLIVTSLLVGTLVALIAALIPAWQAGRISPLEALRIRGHRQEGWLMQHGWILGMVLLTASSLILIVNPFPYDVQFRLGSVTVVMLFFGGTLLIPGSVGIWERLTRPLLRLVFGAAGELGSINIQRGRLRTTLTVAALMVGVSMVIITRGMTTSFRGDLESWIEAYVGGDLLVSSSSPMRSQMMHRLKAVPGVEAVTPMRNIQVTWQKPGGETESLVFMAVDPETYNTVTNFVFSDSRIDAQAVYQNLASGKAVFISSLMAEKYGLKVGDTISLRTRSGLQDFLVAAVVVNFFNQGLTVQGSWQDMRRYFKTGDASAYLLRVTEGYPVAQVQQNIEETYADRENLSVVSNQSILKQVTNLLNQAYSMFDAMAIIAILIAALGVANTLSMNVIERSQEIGMLRSIGMTRAQTMGMVLAESMLIGLIGGVSGLCFGIVLTRIFLWSMTAMSGYKVNFVMPVQAVVAGLAIALVVSQIAAMLPARRAARARILEAIQFE